MVHIFALTMHQVLHLPRMTVYEETPVEDKCRSILLRIDYDLSLLSRRDPMKYALR